MTEEQKLQELERVQRLRDKVRKDALMAKQRIQAYKMARERIRQDKQNQLLPSMLRQDSQGGGGGASSSSTSQRQLQPTRNLTLEPLHDEYSRMLQNSLGAAGSGGAGGDSQLFLPHSNSMQHLAPSGSSSNLMLAPTPRNSSSGGGASAADKLTDVSCSSFKAYISRCFTKRLNISKIQITNVPQNQIKRRTTLVPKQGGAVPINMRRGASVNGAGAGGSNSNAASSASAAAGGGLYKGALNMQDVKEGYGMGMALTANKVGNRWLVIVVCFLWYSLLSCW